MSFQKLSRQQRIQRIRAYLEQISPEHQIESAQEQLESAANLGDSGEQLSVMVYRQGGDEGLEALEVIIRDGDQADVTAGSLDQLEAIIHTTKRPAIDIINDSFNAPSGQWREIGIGEAKKRIEHAIPSVGRIEVPNDVRPYAGTGFVVGDNLLMTNRHVARIFALGLGQQNLRFDPGQTAAVDFKREISRQGAPDPILLRVTNILMIHPYWDMALLEVAGLPDRHPKLELSTQAPEDMVENKIVVIGYPAMDHRSNIEVQNKIFNYSYEIKRLLPGRFTGRKEYIRNNNRANVVSHDSSTLGGSSGSAVIDVETGKVIALHFAGEYLSTNYAVSMHDLAQDSRVVDAGVNFIDTVVHRDTYHSFWEKADPSESMDANPIPPPMPPTTTSTIQIAGNPSANVTIPIHIAVTIGDPKIATSALKQDESEGLFSRQPQPSASKFIHQFSLSSLVSGSFNWNAALSAALGSHLAYEEADKVEQTAIQQWGFDLCEFIQIDNIECFVAASKDAILVAFRGTETSIADWLTDLNFLSTSRQYGRVHRGFLAGFQVVNKRLQTTLNGLPDRPLLLTGHSLGGALATIAAAEWQGMFPISAIYTFGQPAVGKGRFPSFLQDHYENRFFRFVNNNDIITRVPPTYRHTGHLFHFNASGSLNDNSESLNPATAFTDHFEDEKMLTEIQFDRFRASLLQNRIRRLEGVELSKEEGLLPSFSDHKLAGYITKIAAKAANNP